MIKKNGVYVDSDDINGILWDHNNHWDFKLLEPLIKDISQGYSDLDRILVPYAERDTEGFVVEREKTITIERLKERCGFWFSKDDTINGEDYQNI